MPKPGSSNSRGQCDNPLAGALDLLANGEQIGQAPRQQLASPTGQTVFCILECIWDFAVESLQADGEAHSVLMRDPADLVGDASRMLYLLLADAVQRLQVLLWQRFDRDRVQARPACRLADGERIARIALAAAHERFHVLRRDQNHFVTELLKGPAPMVRANARLHCDQGGLQLGDGLGQRRALHCAVGDHFAGPVEGADLEHVFLQDRYRLL